MGGLGRAYIKYINRFDVHTLHVLWGIEKRITPEQKDKVFPKWSVYFQHCTSSVARCRLTQTTLTVAEKSILTLGP